MGNSKDFEQVQRRRKRINEEEGTAEERGSGGGDGKQQLSYRRTANLAIEE